MNPFILMLIQSLLNGSGTNSFWNTPFGDSDGSMFGQKGNPFTFSPFPYGGVGNLRREGIGRQLGRPLATPSSPQTPARPLYGGQPTQPTLQPIPNQQPVDIPAPPPQVPPRNPFGVGLQPVPSQPIDIPAPPFNPGVMIPPSRGPEPFYIQPLPGINIPINMTGIFGQGQGTLPSRPDINYLPPIPTRGIFGR